MIDTSVFEGKTSQEIAEYFRNEGIHGIRDGGYNCPLANWLKKASGLPKANVGTVMGWDGQSSIGNRIAVFPNAVGNFVFSFLNGNYDFLIPEEKSNG